MRDEGLDLGIGNLIKQPSALSPQPSALSPRPSAPPRCQKPTKWDNPPWILRISDMTKFSYLFSARTARIAVLCASAILASTAQADVKMVSRMTMTSSMGASQQQPPQTITAYFRQGMMRSDVGPTSTIMNAKSHQTLILDHNSKSYSQLNMMGGQAAMLKGMKMSISGGIKPTSQKKTIAGKLAHEYVGDFVMKMSMPQMQGQSQTMKMHIEQWATTEVPAALSPSEMMGVMSNMFQGLSGMGGMDTLVKEMGKVKGFPLDNKTTMTMTFAMPPGQQRPQGMPPSFTFSIQNTILSLKVAPVDAGLFKIPAGYKKSATPIAPKMGAGR